MCREMVLLRVALPSPPVAAANTTFRGMSAGIGWFLLAAPVGRPGCDSQVVVASEMPAGEPSRDGREVRERHLVSEGGGDGHRMRHPQCHKGS
jgi:hypothetical protein